MTTFNIENLNHATVWIVGGYVRDRVMGREPKDHDFVVTGATAEDMLNAGFIPIEASAFPVFHHPLTKDEFALARTERKTGSGYHGFEAFSDPTISIEEDLIRRDLTFNAMARKVIGWNELGHAQLDDTIIDPFGGQWDIRNRRIKHVSHAFAEDPVRVLRVARFAARFGFIIADETWDLMKQMVHDGELDHLTPERVWQEWEKALAEPRPDLFFNTLATVGADIRLFPTDVADDIVRATPFIRRAADFGMSVNTINTVVFSESTTDAAMEVMERLRSSSDQKDMVRNFHILRDAVTQGGFGENVLFHTLRELDVLRADQGMLEQLCVLQMILSTDPSIAHRIDMVLRAGHAWMKTRKITCLNRDTSGMTGVEIGNAMNHLRRKLVAEVFADGR